MTLEVLCISFNVCQIGSDARPALTIGAGSTDVCGVVSRILLTVHVGCVEEEDLDVAAFLGIGDGCHGQNMHSVIASARRRDRMVFLMGTHTPVHMV